MDSDAKLFDGNIRLIINSRLCPPWLLLRRLKRALSHMDMVSADIAGVFLLT